MSKARVLCADGTQDLVTTQKAFLTKAGYEVVTAVGRKAIEAELKKSKFDIVILGHALSRDDRHHLPYMVKKSDDEARTLVLHASGGHPQVDKAIDSRQGDEAVLRAIDELLAVPVGV